ncbi:MAG: ABC transporter ATP-binding protein [Alphaproteobacteria bacterium]|nr:ABC transporter ATP-binding protein [Alphaproteobacteria bacterium]
MHENRLIEVDDLRVHFPLEEGSVKAVDGVSWHIDRGEILAVVGESGSGKTVTALSLMRLTDHDGGEIVSGPIRFRSKVGAIVDIAERPLEDMQRIRGNDIAMIFQEPMTSLNPVFTVGEQIVEAIVQHRAISTTNAMKMALEVLEQVRMPDPEKQLSRFPHQLSGGMRQRVMIAMALSCQPSLLIADEPTTALDVTIQARILDLIKLLRDEIGMSVMFITHDMGVVAEVADRVVVMWRGQKVEEGSVDEIFGAPRHPYTKGLLACVPRLGAMRGRSLPAKFANLDIGRDGVDTIGPELLDIKDTVRRDERPLLEVQNLTVRFDVRDGPFGRATARIHAVENVDLTLRAGETLALVGESGCGKSTAGRGIVRLVDPTRGSVVFDGQDLASLSSSELRPYRRRIQMILQDPFASLNPRMTVGSAIAEPMRVHGLADAREARERVAGLLRRVGMEPEHANRYPHEFSGGQRQRLCIARALGLEPDLIIADEVVSALDVSVQAQVINLMMELQEEFALSYLFISHDMAVVERVSHRVAVMYLGEIVETGTRAQVFENPRHPYTRKLMAAVPVADPRLRKTEPDVMVNELPSALRPIGYEPPARDMIEVEPGHMVMKHEEMAA